MKELKIYPDYYVEYKLDRRHVVDIFVVEIKKPEANISQQIDSDYVKLLREMQVILNKLVGLNVKDPVAFGLLVDSYDCILYQMKLNGPGLYDVNVCTAFRTPRDYLDISLLEDICEAILFLNEEITQLCSRIKVSPSNPVQKDSCWKRCLFGRSKKLSNH